MSQSNKERILDLVRSIQADVREVRNLVEIEESNFDQSREWRTKGISPSTIVGSGIVATRTSAT